MDKETKRKSIFKILLTRIFAIVILFNIVQAGLNIHETVSMQRENEERRKQQVENEIINIIDSWNSVLISIESMFYDVQSKTVQKLIEIQSVHDLKSVDLLIQMVQLELDTLNNDLYIIEDGIIVNTTYEPDLGLNFYEFSEVHKNFLLNVLETGVFTPEKFALESSTRRLKCFSYQATEDRKYVVEIGSYSETADLIMQMFRDRLSRIIKDYADIIAVNFWIVFENSQIGFLDDTGLYEDQDSLVLESERTKTDIRTRFRKDQRLYTAEYTYLELDNTSQYFKDVVISIITDITDHNKPVYAIITKQVLITMIFLVLLLLILTLATRSLKYILRDMLRKTTSIASGKLHQRVRVMGENEFTTLAEHFNYMVENLEASYKDLNHKNKVIEDKNITLQEQNEEIASQRDEIEAQRNFVIQQNELLEKQKKAIVDSINYAQKIQQATLPDETMVIDLIPDNFILYKPRDIVSGDFYWMTRVEDRTIIAAADCTGHGVPGAFMSMLGAAFLNEIVNKEYVTHPAVILRKLRKEVIEALQQKGEYGEQKDGMDIAICSIDYEKMQLQFSGANNPLCLVRKNGIEKIKDAKIYEFEDHVLYEIKGDRMPIGIHYRMDSFAMHEIRLHPGDVCYIFSDGFPDQFGGPEGDKFKSRPFKELLLQNSLKSMEEQKNILENKLEEWMKGYEQIDDILVVGFRIG